MKIVSFSYKAQPEYLFYKFSYGSYNVGMRRYAYSFLYEISYILFTWIIIKRHTNSFDHKIA